MSTKKPVKRKSAAKKTAKTATEALARVEITPQTAQSHVKAGLVQLSTFIPNMTPSELAQLDVGLRPITKAFEACAKLVKERLSGLVQKTGTPFNENGSLEAQLPGFRIQSWRYPSKLDSAKVIALVVGKGRPHSDVANARVVTEWDLDEAKLEALVKDGVVAQEELDACKTKERWVLQEPKPVTEVDE